MSATKKRRNSKKNPFDAGGAVSALPKLGSEEGVDM